MLSSLRSKFLGKQETRVLLIGLDGAGKTTILHKLKYGKVIETEIIRKLAPLQPATHNTHDLTHYSHITMIGGWQQRSVSIASA